LAYSITTARGRVVLKVEGTVNIRHAQDLAARLSECLDDGLPVGVDTGDLEDIDTCILQLFCSLRKTVPALAFDNPSEVFVGAADRCGLRRELLGAREGS
jgi:hypothetical protein